MTEPLMVTLRLVEDSDHPDRFYLALEGPADQWIAGPLQGEEGARDMAEIVRNVIERFCAVAGLPHLDIIITSN